MNVWGAIAITLAPAFASAITFVPKVIGLPYCACVFLGTRLFTWYHNCWPCDLGLKVWPTFEKLYPWLLFSDGCHPASDVVFWQLLLYCPFWQYLSVFLSTWQTTTYLSQKQVFYATELKNIVLSCLSDCLSVVIFSLGNNFSTVVYREVIFGMHTQLMKPLWVISMSVTLTLTLMKINFPDFIASKGIVFHKHTLF